MKLDSLQVRRTITIKWVDGRTVREIASATGESIGATHRTINAFRTWLAYIGLDKEPPQRLRDIVSAIVRNAERLHSPKRAA